MGFLDIFTSKLGFNKKEDSNPTPVYPTPTGAPIQRRSMISQATGSSSPFMSTLSSKIGVDKIGVPKIKQTEHTPFTRDLATNLQSIVEPVASVGRAVITRPIRTVIKSFEELGGYLGDPNYKPEPYVPTQPWEQGLYGKEPIKSYPEQGKDIIKISQDIQKPIIGQNGEVYFKGVDKKLAIPLAFFGTLGGPLGDLLPGGGEDKIAIEKVFKGVADDIAEAILKSADNANSFKILKEAGISDDIAKESAQILTNTKTKEEATKAMRDVAAKQLQITERQIGTRIDELKNKQKGVEIDPQTGKKVQKDPVILTADEVDELKFLSKNKTKPENILMSERFSDVKGELSPNPRKTLPQKTVEQLNEIDRNDYEKYLKKKLEDIPTPSKDEETVIFSGDGKGGQYIDTDITKALNRGISEDTNVMNVKKENLISTGDKGKDAVGERLLKADVAIPEKVLKHNVSGEEFKVLSKTGEDSMVESLKTGEKLIIKNTDIQAKFTQSKNIKQVAESKALETAAGIEKERKYITSAKASERVNETIKAELNGTYDPKSNKDLIERASTRVADNIEEAKKMATTQSSDEAVATGVSLTEHYSNKIENAVSKEEKLSIAKEAADVINRQAEILTEAGRTVQAASLLGKQTPEGLLRTTARKIKEYNKLNPTKKVPELSGENVVDILEKGKKIEKMADGIKKEVAIKDLADEMERLIPTPMWKKITNLWKAGMLTGIKTSGVNLMSTFWMGVGEKVSKIPAVGIDMASSLITGKRTKAFVNPVEYMNGAYQGAKNSIKYLKTGISGEVGETALEHYKVYYDSKLGKFLGKGAEGVYRLLGAEDMPFFYGTLKSSLAEQAIVAIKNEGKVFANSTERSKFIENFINNPTDEVLAIAKEDANIATFKNDTALGKMASAIQNSHPLANAILPFAKTPSAVATAMFNYSPAGAVHTLYRNFIKGGFDQKDFAEGLGRAVTGTAALWLGSEIYKQGKISLEYPADEKERAKWEATGKTPNSILIDGKWIPLVSFGPAGSVLGIGGYVQKGKDETGSMAGGVVSGLFGGIKGLTEQTFLTGVKNLVDTINAPEKKGVVFAGGLIGSIVPTIVSDFTAAFDDYQRKASGTILGPLKSRTPIWRQTLPKKLDVWGQPLERNRTVVGTAISPMRLSNIIQGPLNTEVERLGLLGEDIRPTKIDAKIKNINLDNAEYYKYQRLYGNILTKGLTALIKNPSYQAMDPEDQVVIWEKSISEIKKATSELILPALIKNRYELDDSVNEKAVSELVNVLYKKSPDFAKASPEKQKKVILKLLNKGNKQTQ